MFPTARCCFLLPVHTAQPRVVAVPGRLAPARTAVAARARRGARRDRSWDDDGGSGDEDAIDESFFGEPRDDDEEPEEPEEERRRRRPASPGEPPAGQLRGSDVLRALQRAAAAKEAKKKKKHQSTGARPAARRQEKRGGGVTPVQVAVGEVRPIEIRREWAPRIRELELRVQQLVDRQAPPPVINPPAVSGRSIHIHKNQEEDRSFTEPESDLSHENHLLKDSYVSEARIPPESDPVN